MIIHMNPSIWDAESSMARQDYIIYILNKERRPVHINELAKILDVVTNQNELAWTDLKNFHDTKYRRLLTSDIDTINRNMKRSCIISSGRDGLKIARRDDAVEAIAFYRKKALKDLAKASRIAKKVGLDCQIAITGEEIKTFMEEENE